MHPIVNQQGSFKLHPDKHTNRPESVVPIAREDVAPGPVLSQRPPHRSLLHGICLGSLMHDSHELMACTACAAGRSRRPAT